MGNRDHLSLSRPLFRSSFLRKNVNRMMAFAADPMNVWPSPWISRKLFGNTAGMRSNLNGVLALMRARWRNPASATDDYADLGRMLASEGVVMIPGLYPIEIIEQVAAGCRHLFETEGEPVATQLIIDGKVYRTGHANPHLRVPGYINLVDHRVRGIVTSYFRSAMEVFDSRTWRNYHVPEEITQKREVLSSHWHCDTIDMSTVKLFVILSDVTDVDGPLHVMSHSATREAVRRGYKSRDDIGGAQDFMANPKNFIKLVGPPGTAVLCRSAMCFHRAGIPENGHSRDIAELRMRPLACRADA